MVCWEIVEPHLPSRVMRQFSMVQQIPTNVYLSPAEHKRLHKMKKGRSVNWLTKHADYINHWHSRHENVVDGEYTQHFRASNEYMNWYWLRTVVHVANPVLSHGTGFQNSSGRQELLMECVSRMHRGQGSGNDMSHLPQSYMDHLGATHRLFLEPVHFSQDHGAFPGPPPPPVRTHRRHSSTRARQMRGEPSFRVDETQPFPPATTSSFNQGGPSTSYHVGGPSTFQAGGTSTQQEFDVSHIPDLNAEAGFSDRVSSHVDNMHTFDVDEIYTMLGGPHPSTYVTPTESHHPFGDGVYSPQMPEDQPRDVFRGQPHDPVTPVPFQMDSPIFMPDSLNLSLHSPQFATQTPADEYNLAEWNLVRDRAARERRPRGPCFTSERHMHPPPDTHM